MENSNKKRKVYVSIGSGRLLNIRVVLDDNPTPIYEGMVEDAPEEIKDLKYSKVNVASQITYYVYSDVN
ncbi:MAG: hypothetical protein Q4C39_06135 [Clostridia bacterium]|nr:hypothetical protein [Clostridia bacterium]